MCSMYFFIVLVQILVHVLWCRMKEEPSILKHLRGGMLHEEMVQHKSQLQGLRVCMAPLLAMRRHTCPRLFLLPDQDLLELLTKGQVCAAEGTLCTARYGRILGYHKRIC